MGFYSISDPPENVQLMTNATASKACQNDVVSFMCSADAVPSAMSFQLFKDNVAMEASDSGMWTKPLSEGGVFAYKCVANNSIGSASSANAIITVNGEWDQQLLTLTLASVKQVTKMFNLVFNIAWKAKLRIYHPSSNLLTTWFVERQVCCWW